MSEASELFLQPFIKAPSRVAAREGWKPPHEKRTTVSVSLSATFEDKRTPCPRLKPECSLTPPAVGTRSRPSCLLLNNSITTLATPAHPPTARRLGCNFCVQHGGVRADGIAPQGALQLIDFGFDPILKTIEWSRSRRNSVALLYPVAALEWTLRRADCAIAMLSLE